MVTVGGFGEILPFAILGEDSNTRSPCSKGRSQKKNRFV